MRQAWHCVEFPASSFILTSCSVSCRVQHVNFNIVINIVIPDWTGLKNKELHSEKHTFAVSAVVHDVTVALRTGGSRCYSRRRCDAEECAAGAQYWVALDPYYYSSGSPTASTRLHAR
jgi:hypothetical protein